MIAIEIPHGPVVETLIERGFKVHSINPKQMDRFHDRFTLVGVKKPACGSENPGQCPNGKRPGNGAFHVIGR